MRAERALRRSRNLVFCSERFKSFANASTLRQRNRQPERIAQFSPIFCAHALEEKAYLRSNSTKDQWGVNEQIVQVQVVDAELRLRAVPPDPCFVYRFNDRDRADAFRVQ